MATASKIYKKEPNDDKVIFYKVPTTTKMRNSVASKQVDGRQKSKEMTIAMGEQARWQMIIKR